MHQPLLAELDSEEKTRELQARLGISVFHQVVSAQQILDLACMFVILFCILTRPSLFSFCLLVFLSFYTLHAGYPWQAAARYLIIPVCLIIFVQYIGSFASVLALPAGIRTLLDALGVSSAEPFEPVNETLVLFSADSREQFAYNVRLMIGFMTVGVVCIVMSALDTERFAAVYSLLAFCWRRLQCAFAKWSSLNEKETLQRIRIERSELMEHVVSSVSSVSTVSPVGLSETPASPGSIRDSLTSEVDWSEMEREIDESLPRGNDMEVATKKLAALKKAERRASRRDRIRRCFTVVITQIAQFALEAFRFVDKWMGPILQCIVITCFTLGGRFLVSPFRIAGQNTLDGLVNLLLLGLLLFSRGTDCVMKLLGAWNLFAFFWIAVPSRSDDGGRSRVEWILSAKTAGLSDVWREFLLVRDDGLWLYRNIVSFVLLGLKRSHEAAAKTRSEDEARAASTEQKTAEHTLWRDVDSRNRGYFVAASFFAPAAGRIILGGFILRLAAAALLFHALLLFPLPPHAVHPRGDCDLECGRRCCTRRRCE